MLVTILFFDAGFLVSGSALNNYLLRIISILLMLLLGVGYTFALMLWFKPWDIEDYFWVLYSIFIDCSFVFHGMGILRLKKYLRTNLPAVSAVLFILTGVIIITVFLFILGLFFLIPVSILQLILLYRIKEVLTKKPQNLFY